MVESGRAKRTLPATRLPMTSPTPMAPMIRPSAASPCKPNRCGSCSTTISAMASCSATLHGPLAKALTRSNAPVVGSLSIRRAPSSRASQAPRQPPRLGRGLLAGSITRSRTAHTARPDSTKPAAVTDRKWITGMSAFSTAASVGPIRRASRKVASNRPLIPCSASRSFTSTGTADCSAGLKTMRMAASPMTEITSSGMEMPQM